MKIQMHQQLEKWAQLFASVLAGTMASPPTQIITKQVRRERKKTKTNKKKPDNFWVQGFTRVLPWLDHYGQTEKQKSTVSESHLGSVQICKASYTKLQVVERDDILIKA